MSDKLYDAALEAIGEMFGDDSVSASTTIQNLRSLKGEIDILIESLSECEEDE